MRIVLDTNVLVSGLVSPHGPPAQVVRLAIGGDLVVLYDDRLVAQYHEVLSRPKFAFDPEDVRIVVEQIERRGEVISALPLDVDLPDPDDRPFLEVAAAGAADCLITGNARHFRPTRGRHRVKILSPREVLARVAEEQGR